MTYRGNFSKHPIAPETGSPAHTRTRLAQSSDLELKPTQATLLVCLSWDALCVPQAVGSKRGHPSISYIWSLLDTATWPCPVKEYKIILEPSLLTGWLANWLVSWLCCQPRFQFHEVKAVKIRGENCKRGCTPIFFSLSIAKAM